MANTIGFGQAAVNNTNGFGKAPTNNTIDFGEVCADSWSPETNLTGAGATPPFSNTKSIELDGIDDYVDCGNFSAYDNGDLSFSMWVYKTTSGLEYVFSNSGSGTVAGFAVVIWDKHIKIDRRTRTKQSSSAYKLLGLNYNTWHNIIGTYNDTTDVLKVYFDGTFKATYSASSDVNSASTPLNIGSYAGTSNFFQGNIDEVSIFNTELSASDVTSIYNGGVPNDISSLNPLGWWRCGDGDTSPTLTDNGSGGNDGTMTNFSTFSTDVPT